MIWFKIRESCFKSHIPVLIKVEYGKMFFVEYLFWKLLWNIQNEVNLT